MKKLLKTTALDMTRRGFLIAGTVSLGWSLLPEIMKEILHAEKVHREILPVELPDAENLLTIGRRSGLIALRDPSGDIDYDPEEMEMYTWDEYLASQGYSDPTKESLRKYLENYAPDAMEDFFPEIDENEYDLEDPDQVDALEELKSAWKDQLGKIMPDEYRTGPWDDHYYENHIGPGVPYRRAFEYLQDLKLGYRGGGKNPIGEIRFRGWERGRPDRAYVTASGLAVISGLQQRLIELGEPTEVKIVDDDDEWLAD